MAGLLDDVDIREVTADLMELRHIDDEVDEVDVFALEWIDEADDEQVVMVEVQNLIDE